MWSSGRSSGCAPSPPPQHWPWRVWCAGCARPSAPDAPEKAAGRALERRTPAPTTPPPPPPPTARPAGVQRRRCGPAPNHSTTEKPHERERRRATPLDAEALAVLDLPPLLRTQNPPPPPRLDQSPPPARQHLPQRQ